MAGSKLGGKSDTPNMPQEKLESQTVSLEQPSKHGPIPAERKLDSHR